MIIDQTGSYRLISEERSLLHRMNTPVPVELRQNVNGVGRDRRLTVEPEKAAANATSSASAGQGLAVE
jgi:hypothetical protein